MLHLTITCDKEIIKNSNSDLHILPLHDYYFLTCLTDLQKYCPVPKGLLYSSLSNKNRATEVIFQLCIVFLSIASCILLWSFTDIPNLNQSYGKRTSDHYYSLFFRLPDYIISLRELNL